MTYKGRVENGTIKLVDAPKLPEGTEVSVMVEQPISIVPPRGTLAAILGNDAHFIEGYPGEMDDLLRMLKNDHDEDVRMQQERDQRLGEL